ncbi:pilus assembly protein PilM [Thalassoroseus pseudoceratinae]|uniref:pilus assembly protein PilM n=1 Tax=Thalassoroseus pseudoceratinae TaxID=2713176 RepID=UPI001422361C|nr:pilus assembly protein PilM [Thalassoroseus pseudoceratinae]
MSLLMPARLTHRKQQTERIYGRQTPWLGVDVGTHSIKLAVVTRNRRGQWNLDYAQRIPWPKDAEPFSSADRFGEALHEVLRQAESVWRTKNLTQVAFSLPSSAVSTQDLCHDADDLATIHTTATQTIREIYGSRPEKLAFDVWRPDPVEDSFADPPTSQLLWAEPDVVKNCVEVFRDCRLTAEILDMPPLTTARASEMLEGARESELIVDWGVTRLTLTWILKGRPRFTRYSIQSGVADLVQSINDAQDLTSTDTELVLARYGLPADTISGFNRTIEKTAADSLEVLLDEIDCTLTYLGTRYPRRTIDRIVLSGGGAAIRNLDYWLTSQIGIDSVQWMLPFGDGQATWQSLDPIPLFAHAASLSGLGYES